MQFILYSPQVNIKNLIRAELNNSNYNKYTHFIIINIFL